MRGFQSAPVKPKAWGPILTRPIINDQYAIYYSGSLFIISIRSFFRRQAAMTKEKQGESADNITGHQCCLVLGNFDFVLGIFR